MTSTANRPTIPVKAARRSTPRPTFDAATVIRRDETAHHVWGDLGAGLVTDRVYVSTDTLHVLEFELAPGGGFRHSATNKTVFAADVMYCVLDGTLVIADPQYGEVQLVSSGQSVLFGRDTWHHGFNPFQETVRVVEFFAPPPSQGTASEYAKLQPELDSVTYRDDRWDRNWPHARADHAATSRFTVCDKQGALWSFAKDSPSHLAGTLADTEFLTVHTGLVSSGHAEDLSPVIDETLLVVTEGELWVDVATADSSSFSPACLRPGDAMFAPRGTQIRVLSRSGMPATYLRGSARPVPEGWAP